MTPPQASTSKTLNPFAPEYNPISPGVTPTPHAPPPPFFPPPPCAARRPPPHLQPPQIHYHQPSTKLSTPQHYFYSSYYVSSFHNKFPNTPPRQQARAPPTTVVSVKRGRGSARGGRGYWRRGRESCWIGSGKISSFGSERRVDFCEKHQQFSKLRTRNEGNRHEVLPLKPDEDKTTVMIKNIPYDCPRREMISMLDDFCSLENQMACGEGKSAEELITPYAYDFLYLPIDFRSKKSRGFAFVNFTTSKAVWKLFDSFHLKKWDFVERYMKWHKKIEIVCAQIQGKDNLVKHFSESLFECESDEFLPVAFSPARDGSGQPVDVTVVGNRRAPPAARWDSRRNH